MSLFIPTVSDSVLIVVDLQPSFMKTIFEKDRVMGRSVFLAKIASLLDVPVLATVQNPERMGGLHEEIASYVGNPVEGKMAFSCMGCAALERRLREIEREQVVLVGIETHICVSQTAHHLIDQGFEVAVCADAVSARSQGRHEIGLSRMREAGIVIAHTESIAYEWLLTADHPKFKQALEIVKASE